MEESAITQIACLERQIRQLIDKVAVAEHALRYKENTAETLEKQLKETTQKLEVSEQKWKNQEGMAASQACKIRQLQGALDQCHAICNPSTIEYHEPLRRIVLTGQSETQDGFYTPKMERSTTIQNTGMDSALPMAARFTPNLISKLIDNGNSGVRRSTSSAQGFDDCLQSGFAALSPSHEAASEPCECSFTSTVGRPRPHFVNEHGGSLKQSDLHVPQSDVDNGAEKIQAAAGLVASTQTNGFGICVDNKSKTNGLPATGAVSRVRIGSPTSCPLRHQDSSAQVSNDSQTPCSVWCVEDDPQFVNYVGCVDSQTSCSFQRLEADVQTLNNIGPGRVDAQTSCSVFCVEKNLQASNFMGCVDSQTSCSVQLLEVDAQASNDKECVGVGSQTASVPLCVEFAAQTVSRVFLTENGVQASRNSDGLLKIENVPGVELTTNNNVVDVVCPCIDISEANLLKAMGEKKQREIDYEKYALAELEWYHRSLQKDTYDAESTLSQLRYARDVVLAKLANARSENNRIETEFNLANKKNSVEIQQAEAKLSTSEMELLAIDEKLKQTRLIVETREKSLCALIETERKLTCEIEEHSRICYKKSVERHQNVSKRLGVASSPPLTIPIDISAEFSDKSSYLNDSETSVSEDQTNEETCKRTTKELEICLTAGASQWREFMCESAKLTVQISNAKRERTRLETNLQMHIRQTKTSLETLNMEASQLEKLKKTATSEKKEMESVLVEESNKAKQLALDLEATERRNNCQLAALQQKLEVQTAAIKDLNRKLADTSAHTASSSQRSPSTNFEASEFQRDAATQPDSVNSEFIGLEREKTATLANQRRANVVARNFPNYRQRSTPEQQVSSAARPCRQIGRGVSCNLLHKTPGGAGDSGRYSDEPAANALPTSQRGRINYLETLKKELRDVKMENERLRRPRI